MTHTKFSIDIFIWVRWLCDKPTEYNVDSDSAVPLSITKLHSVSSLVLVLQLKFILKVHADDGKAKVVSKEKADTHLKYSPNATREGAKGLETQLQLTGRSGKWLLFILWSDLQYSNEVQVCRVKQAQVIGNCNEK